MLWESWIQDLCYRFVSNEGLRKERRGLRLLTQPDVERAHPAHQEPRFEWSEDRADLTSDALNAHPEVAFFRRYDSSSDDIRMAIQVFRC
jgi:hypothetical protein